MWRRHGIRMRTQTRTRTIIAGSPTSLQLGCGITVFSLTQHPLYHSVMRLSTTDEIERAIATLTPRELEQLYSWLDQNHPQPIDSRIESDLAAGRLDTAIQQALDDERSGQVRPL